MSSKDLLSALVRPVYPERPDQRPASWLDEKGARYAGMLARAIRAHRVRRSDIVGLVRASEDDLPAMDIAALRAAALEIGKSLRRDGFRIALVARAFAIVSAASALTLGKRHFDVQLQGGWVMLQGMVAEMETGEGKTLTATLATCTAALAGIPVHVITVNDYLVARDAEITRPLYEALGLTVGVATEQQEPAQRQQAYACHITYASNKIIVFDYLRDRVTLSSRNSALRLQLEKLGGSSARTSRLLMRGLHFAIVDEADSVLADEARTPLIISAPVDAGDQQRLAEQGIALARQLAEGEHFTLDMAERSVKLSEAGRARVGALSAPWGGLWSGRLRREEMATQALSALHLFFLDDHYLVRDGKVEIIDENTGRTMADRSWERGLHQLIESKEGLEVTAPKEPLARISYQRFFRRYLLLAGMTGTASEVAGELGTVYNLAAVKIPTNRPGRRKLLAQRVFASADDKWAAIVARVAQVHASGQPVLLGTRSVAASEHASRLLAGAGLAHQILNAKQDRAEADIVACAGQPGRITIATNMAGRGTDIVLSGGAAELGGLYVILSERYDSQRIDRQLAGRCARQGDPGAVEAILSLDDALLSARSRHYRKALAASLANMGPELGRRCASLAIRLAQKRAERATSRARMEMLKLDQQTGKSLAFSGSNE
jgi:preprotein translocase subunit SecA